MTDLFMDASKWKTLDDLYDSFFEAVKAPAWHGRNLNAVRDSIGVGQINEIEVPYRLVLTHYDRVSGHLKEATEIFIQVVSDLEKKGIPVKIRIENSN
jgi:RNAse (barnase) inhibitor barstar